MLLFRVESVQQHPVAINPRPSVAREPISAAGSIRPNGGRLLSSPIMETNAGLSAHRERPRDRRVAEQRDELATFQLIELHSVPASQGRIA